MTLGGALKPKQTPSKKTKNGFLSSIYGFDAEVSSGALGAIFKSWERWVSIKGAMLSIAPSSLWDKGKEWLIMHGSVLYQNTPEREGM